jgi:hypothetical protein
LRTLHQFRVLRNTALWFVNAVSDDHFNRENVSRFEISIYPPEVFAHVTIF